MKKSIIIGTRPEIIKMMTMIHECNRINFNYFILHTCQHYSYNKDKIFFEQFGLVYLQYNLDIGSGSHAEQSGKMLPGIKKNLIKENP